MEENKNTKLENFAKDISNKYDFEEKVLIDALNIGPKEFWEALFQMINKKNTINNTSTSVDKENNNILNFDKSFNKEDIEKEIEDYFNENPNEDKQIWEKIKNGDVNENVTVNKSLEAINRVKTEIPSTTSASTEKKYDLGSINKLRKIPSPTKRKKSFSVYKNKKSNFSNKITNAPRHQSIFAELNSLKKLNINRPSIRIQKKNSIVKSNNKINNNDSNIKYSKTFRINQNFKSLALKIEKHNNLEYNSKKKHLEIKSRGSFFIPNNNYGFHFNINNLDAIKRKGTKNIEKVKNRFSGKFFHKNNKKEENNKDEIKLDSEESNKNSSNSSYLAQAKKNLINENNIIEEEDNNEINLLDLSHSSNEISKDNSPKNENHEDIKVIIPVHKNKSTFLKIFKKKEKIQPLPEPENKIEPKKYLNNSICHQVSITLLKAINNSSKIKNNNAKSKNILNNYPLYDKKFDKYIGNLTNKDNKTDDTVENNEKFNTDKKNKKIISKIKIEKKKNEDDDEDDIYNNGLIYNFEKRFDKNNNLKKKLFNHSTKFKDNIISRNNLIKNFGKYTHSSAKNINILNKTKKKNQDFSFYKPQITLITKKAEIKYYKMSNRNVNNSEYKNKSINNKYNKYDKYDITRFNKDKNLKSEKKVKNKIIKIKKLYNNKINNLSKKLINNKNNNYTNNNVTKNKFTNNNYTDNNNYNITNNITYYKDNYNNSNLMTNKKSYLEKYKETLANIMKNDNSIFSDEGEILYIKKKSKRILKNGVNNEMKKNQFKSYYKTEKKYQKSQKTSLIKNKKNIFGSCDNIYKTKYKH